MNRRLNGDIGSNLDLRPPISHIRLCFRILPNSVDKITKSYSLKTKLYTKQ